MVKIIFCSLAIKVSKVLLSSLILSLNPQILTGVGKNKLADKLVQMLNFEREYIQVRPTF